LFALIFWLWHNNLKESQLEDKIRRLAKANATRARKELIQASQMEQTGLLSSQDD
jgi:hypothetical protein